MRDARTPGAEAFSPSNRPRASTSRRQSSSLMPRCEIVSSLRLGLSLAVQPRLSPPTTSDSSHVARNASYEGVSAASGCGSGTSNSSSEIMLWRPNANADLREGNIVRRRLDVERQRRRRADAQLVVLDERPPQARAQLALPERDRPPRAVVVEAEQLGDGDELVERQKVAGRVDWRGGGVSASGRVPERGNLYRDRRTCEPAVEVEQAGLDGRQARPDAVCTEVSLRDAPRLPDVAAQGRVVCEEPDAKHESDKGRERRASGRWTHTTGRSRAARTGGPR